MKIQTLKIFTDNGDYIHLNNGEVAFSLKVYKRDEFTMPKIYNPFVIQELQDLFRKYGYSFLKKKNFFEKILDRINDFKYKFFKRFYNKPPSKYKIEKYLENDSFFIN